MNRLDRLEGRAADLRMALEGDHEHNAVLAAHMGVHWKRQLAAVEAEQARTEARLRLLLAGGEAGPEPEAAV